ncbi:hypothetical protein TNIN_173841 [Trichonephila inaurata madagascariensis]|uniref:Uncharacterized protein n=1 Tax=Trichonephila inaurata madagascariensis TaxID=2747483 RepID=A0A8X6YR96_9ARAC|nr:hypothetical protein TNIN_173841 [Trichonephila inaurata madagascariensis]
MNNFCSIYDSHSGCIDLKGSGKLLYDMRRCLEKKAMEVFSVKAFMQYCTCNEIVDKMVIAKVLSLSHFGKSLVELMWRKKSDFDLSQPQNQGHNISSSVNEHRNFPISIGKYYWKFCFACHTFPIIEHLL